MADVLSFNGKGSWCRISPPALKSEFCWKSMFIAETLICLQFRPLFLSVDGECLREMELVPGSLLHGAKVTSIGIMMGRRKVARESISEAQRSVRVLLAERD